MNFREFKEQVKKMPFFSSDMGDICSSSPTTFRNQLTRWKKQGLLLELRRGIYTLSKSERLVNFSKETAASNIYQPSYISLESALSYYKMIPERVMATTSVTTRKTKKFTNPLGVFIYRQVNVSLFFGFVAKKDEFGFPYFMAEPEKALLDYIYLNLGKINPNNKGFIKESLRLQNFSTIHKKKLLQYAAKYKIAKLSRLVEQLE